MPKKPSAPKAGSTVETTGRYLVLYRDKASLRELGTTLGAKVARSSDFQGSIVSIEEVGTDVLAFEELNVAVVTAAPDQAGALTASASETSSILAVEPERIVHAIVDPSYLRGFRDGVSSVVDKALAGEGPAEDQEELTAAALNETQFTWGLQAARVHTSTRSGRSIKVAVLDTGFDLSHPDFAGRPVTSQSFVTGQVVQDGNGHGTHCIGTSCGPRNPGVLPRYGCSFNASIFAGKVLSNQGSGSDTQILNGINWALGNGCQVISMSLGAPVQPGQGFSAVFESVARIGLNRGSLIVAAAGNESDRRNGVFAPVGHPANCPSIMAVAAVDSSLRVANFSCRGINHNGGQVDIAGPGVDIRSSWPMPLRYRTISGTSMATPHVAGIAAMHIEADPTATGQKLFLRLVQTARRLRASSRDVGAGLVQAPQ